MSRARDVGAKLVSSSLADRVLRVLQRVPQPRGAVTILTLHRLDDGSDHLYPGLAGPTPAEFEELITALASHSHPIGATQLRDAVRGHAPPPRATLVTFDDGYRDFANIAWPILRRHGVPTVLFVPTAFPAAAGSSGQTFWWDRLHGALAAASSDARRAAGLPADGTDAFRALRAQLKAMPHDEAMQRVDSLVERLTGDTPPTHAPSAVLNWNELERLAADGVTVAPHTRNHPLLERLPSERLEEEIAGSLEDLRAHLGQVEPIFAYPSGSFDPAVRAAVARCGFDVAVTTERGVAYPGRGDPLTLPRINIGRRSTTALVGAQASYFAYHCHLGTASVRGRRSMSYAWRAHASGALTMAFRPDRGSPQRGGGPGMDQE